MKKKLLPILIPITRVTTHYGTTVTNRFELRDPESNEIVASHPSRVGSMDIDSDFIKQWLSYPDNQKPLIEAEMDWVQTADGKVKQWEYAEDPAGVIVLNFVQPVASENWNISIDASAVVPQLASSEVSDSSGMKFAIPTTIIDEETGNSLLTEHPTWFDRDILDAFTAGRNSTAIDSSYTLSLNWLEDRKSGRK